MTTTYWDANTMREVRNMKAGLNYKTVPVAALPHLGYAQAVMWYGFVGTRVEWESFQQDPEGYELMKAEEREREARARQQMWTNRNSGLTVNGRRTDSISRVDDAWRHDLSDPCKALTLITSVEHPLFNENPEEAEWLRKQAALYADLQVPVARSPRLLPWYPWVLFSFFLFAIIMCLAAVVLASP